VTGLLSTSGSQFRDWSSAYRLFSESRLDPETLFAGIRSACREQIPETAPLCLSVDDSLLPKSGTKIPGVGWRRDPQGPPFQTNLIRAQRVLQFSALVPLEGAAVRGIPVDFVHAPTPPKPSARASTEQKQEYQKQAEQCNLATRAIAALKRIQESFGDRHPIVLSDARFTTKRFLTNLPGNARLIGRIRKDARLFYPALQQPARGRRRCYGDPCPTPDQIRQDDERFPWQTVRIHAAGADHDCRIKVLDRVLWAPAGPQRILRLVIIAPLRYRPRKGACLLYRDPAFLICTDLSLSPQQMVQFYFWRWDIEVNFREEKTLLGVGQAQVRNEESCQTLPAFQVATYALLLLASTGVNNTDLLPLPKWRAGQQPERISTQRLIQNLRCDVWGRGLGLTNFSGFCPESASMQKPEKFTSSVAAAVLYAQN